MPLTMDRVRFEKARSACPTELKATIHNGLIWHCTLCDVNWKPDQPFPGCQGTPERMEVLVPREKPDVPFPFKVIAIMMVMIAVPLITFATLALVK